VSTWAESSFFRSAVESIAELAADTGVSGVVAAAVRPDGSADDVRRALLSNFLKTKEEIYRSERLLDFVK